MTSKQPLSLSLSFSSFIEIYILNIHINYILMA